MSSRENLGIGQPEPAAARGSNSQDETSVGAGGQPAIAAGLPRNGEAYGDAESALPKWATWSPLVGACLTVLLVVLLQRAVGVNQFSIPPVRASRELNFDVTALAMASARTNWASAILLASVVMILIAVPSILAVMRSRLTTPIKFASAAIAIAIPLTIVVHPGLVISIAHDQEMLAVLLASGFSPKATLVFFLAGLYSTAFILAMGLVSTLRSANSSHLSAQALVSARRVIRDALATTAAWLVVGVVGIGHFHRMSRACLSSVGLTEFDAATTSSTIFAGTFFSALIAATFLPAEFMLRELATGAARRTNGDDVAKIEEWLQVNGFSLSVPKTLTNTVAVFAPLLAGVLQNVVKLS
jgi:hypothetical protein